MIAAAVFAGLVAASIAVLTVIELIGRHSDRRRTVYVSKRCLRVFDPDPERCGQ